MGLIYDPEEAFGAKINDGLFHISPAKIKNCLILLGDPGMGKSYELDILHSNLIQREGKERVHKMKLNDYFGSPVGMLHELRSG